MNVNSNEFSAFKCSEELTERHICSEELTERHICGEELTERHICGEELTERHIFWIRTLLHKFSFPAILLFTSLHTDIFIYSYYKFRHIYISLF